MKQVIAVIEMEQFQEQSLSPGGRWSCGDHFSETEAEGGSG